MKPNIETKEAKRTPEVLDLPENPTWPGKCVDMRRKQNKIALKMARHTKHVRYGAYGSNSFTGVKMAWEFSNKLLAALTKVKGGGE